MENSSAHEEIAKFQSKLDQMKAELASMQNDHCNKSKAVQCSESKNQEQQQYACTVDLKQNELFKTKNIVLAEELSCKKIILDSTQQTIWNKVEMLSSKFMKDLLDAVNYKYVEDMFCRDDDDRDVETNLKENARLKGEHEALVSFKEHQMHRISTASQSLAKVQQNYSNVKGQQQ